MWWEPQPYLLPPLGATVGPATPATLQATESKLLEDLHHRQTHSGLLMHDLLSLATFDLEGTKAVCGQHRLNTPPGAMSTSTNGIATEGGTSSSSTSPASATSPHLLPYLPAEFVDQVANNKQVIELSAEKQFITRTALDFFCRCSKKGFLDSIHVLGEEECLRLQAEAKVQPNGPTSSTSTSSSSAGPESSEAGHTAEVVPVPSTPMTCSHCTKIHHVVASDWVEVMARFEKKKITETQT
jgi:hypothetical protein